MSQYEKEGASDTQWTCTYTATSIFISTFQCKPQADTRCARCEASGETCQYLSVGEDSLQNGRQSFSNDPEAFTLHFLEPAPSLSGGITPYSPSSEDSSLSFGNDSNYSPFHTPFSLESVSNPEPHGISAIYARSDNDPAIVPSSTWPSNGPNIDMSQLNLSHYSNITSPTSTAHALTEDQPPRVFQSGHYSTLEDGGQGYGINSDSIYASPLAQSAYWNHQNNYLSGQDISAGDGASRYPHILQFQISFSNEYHCRCEVCVARPCWHHPRNWVPIPATLPSTLYFPCRIHFSQTFPLPWWVHYSSL